VNATIRLSADARQVFTTRLAGRTYRVSAWWQPSDGHWYLSVEGVAEGVRLVEDGMPLAGLSPSVGGQLYVAGSGEPGRYAWGQTHRLVFVEDAELGL